MGVVSKEIEKRDEYILQLQQCIKELEAKNESYARIEKASCDATEFRKVEAENQRLRELCERILYAYAWWKDGIMYVGSGTITYKEALKDLQKELKALEGNKRSCHENEGKEKFK